MPTSKVNVWYGWVPDRPDQRNKLYAAIAAPPRTLPSTVDLRLGVCTEKLWPYKIARFTKKPPSACYKQARDHQITSYHRIIGLQQMKQCLAEGYPFVFGFSVYEAFESPQVAKTGRCLRA
jgi:hypothetical protein